MPCPEPGVHYRLSGVPKELCEHEKTLARDERGAVISIILGPKATALPSLFEAEVKKRLYSYLSRFQIFLADLIKNNPKLVDTIEIDLSGSFWKYYRSYLPASFQPYEGSGGDFSKDANMAYRKSLDQFFLL